MRSALAHVLCYSIVLASSLPSLVVIYTSLRKTSGPVFKPGYALDSYARILREVPQVIGNSFVHSLVAVMLIVVLGSLIGYLVSRHETRMAGILDTVLFIPYIVPGVVLGLALVEAAGSLGASPARAFAVITLPLMRPGIVAGALMSFITAINELSSCLILYVGRTMTMPVRIYLSMLDGEFGTAAALSTILLLTSGGRDVRGVPASARGNLARRTAFVTCDRCARRRDQSLSPICDCW